VGREIQPFFEAALFFPLKRLQPKGWTKWQKGAKRNRGV
jgi:hypothetical protein